MTKIFFLLGIFLLCDFSLAQEEDAADHFGSLSIGHNLSTNNRALGQNQWSLGTLYLAYGVTDQFSVGISPFVLSQYEMFNVMTRYVWKLPEQQSIGFDFAYFKTFGGKENIYEACLPDESGDAIHCTNYKSYSGFLMEALNTKLTYSSQINGYYRFNTTLSYFYYFDDRAPFSFRMDPANNDPFALNLTSLNEFKVNKNLFINLEAGLWGLNYNYLYYHTGLTINIQNSSGIFGIGASTTFSPTFPKEKAKYFAGYDSRMAIHPEIQMQLFF